VALTAITLAISRLSGAMISRSRQTHDLRRWRALPNRLLLAIGSSRSTHTLSVAAELYLFDSGEEGGRPGALLELAHELTRAASQPRSFTAYLGVRMAELTRAPADRWF
jgi:hypothetical protein